MGCIQSYFKRAHNAGLSPSTTQDSNSKTGAEDGVVPVNGPVVEKDKVSAEFTSGEKQPEEPESNDTSYGVEATAVRTLAASTGTVAILGTTAKTPQSRRESRVSNVEQLDSDDLQINKVSSNNNLNEASQKKDESIERKEITADSIKVEIKDEKNENKASEEVSTNLVSNDIKLDEVAKTLEKNEPILNNLSDFDLKLEDLKSTVEVVCHEITKQGDEISTKQTITALIEDVKIVDSITQPNTDDIVPVNGISPLEDAGFSENNFTNELEDEDDRPTTVLEIEKTSNETRNSISENSESEDTKGINDDISSEQLKTNSLSDTTLSESYNAGLDSIKHSSDGEITTPLVEQVKDVNVEDKDEEKDIEESEKNVFSGENLKNGDPVPANENEKEVIEDKIVIEKELSALESKNDSLINDKKEATEETIIKSVANKVESAVTTNQIVASVTKCVDQEENLLDYLSKEDIPTADMKKKVENGLQSTVTETLSNQKSISVDDNAKINEESITCEQVAISESAPLNTIIDEKNGELDSDKMSAAATTIQASFRGYQTRQQNAKNTMNEEEKSVAADVKEASNSSQQNTTVVSENKTIRDIEIVDEETEKRLKQAILSEEGNIEDGAVERMEAAATAIQASFRGYQTRQNMKQDDKINEVPHNDTTRKDSIEDSMKSNISSQEEVQLSKVPDISEHETVTKSNSPVNIQVNAVKISNDSSETSSFDSVQNGSSNIDPVTSISIKDKSEVSDDKLDEVIAKDVVDNLPITERKSASLDNELVIEKPSDLLSSSQKLTTDEGLQETEISKDESDKILEKAAATTIQANFRGYQVRQTLNKKEANELEESKGDVEESKEVDTNEGVTNNQDEEVSSAATKIQAGFRGYQTRKKLKDKEDDTEIVEALTSRTPDLINTVKEEVEEICKHAVETTEGIISQGLHKFHQSESSPEKKEEEEEEEEKKTEGDKFVPAELADKEEVVEVAKQTIEAVLEKAEQIADEKLNSAATTIQASFRGFQARQNLEKINDPDVAKEESEVEEERDEDIDNMIDQMFGNLKNGIPDFPPSTDEDYTLGTPVPDDDLPLPDFEALESSYSEEVATEPLLAPHFENLPIPESEEISEASTEVGTVEDDLKTLQRPQECDELGRLESSSDGESSQSLSSAATKIQAGVRGYLTRKHINHGQGGTTSTSGPSYLSSDRSLGDFGSSREEDGPVRSMISTEEETEICRHRITPESDRRNKDNRLIKKRMSLDSKMSVAPVKLSRTSRAMSVSAVREDASNEEVWQMLQSELADAATKIQSNFRGYQARKQLRRGDAVQMPTTSSSNTPGSNSVDSSVSRTGHIGDNTRSSGEFHDMIALTPPNIPMLGEEDEEKADDDGGEVKGGAEKGASRDSSCIRDESAMVKRSHDSRSAELEASQTDKVDDVDRADNAAAKIQAGFRGYKVRRDMNAQDVASAAQTASATSEKNASASTLPSPSSAEVEAATKIQAGFRGFKTRQELKSKSADNDSK